MATEFSIEDQPGYILKRAATVMMADLADRLAPLNLRVSDASVLIRIGSHTNMTSSDIGKALDVQRANMVPLLGNLQNAGLIARHPINRKSYAIVLTPEGQALRAKAVAVIEAFEADLIARIAPENWNGFVSGLQSLIRTSK